ncbi:MAG: carboxymuconolactone decarboxylase family protein [Nitrospinota bacterium]
MARVPLIEYDEATEDVRTLYDAQEQQLGRVLNTTKARAHRPPILKAVTGMIQATESDPSFPPDLRALINIRVSQINGCPH